VSILYAAGLTDEIAAIVHRGGIGVLRTDTLYGIVAQAKNEKAVERVYRAKTRTPSKSPIVLIASPDDMFDTYDRSTYLRLKELWPGRNSIILPSTEAPFWIRRDNGSVAYRVPDDPELRNFLMQTGPLIAPSANIEGEAPAMSIKQAEAYFGTTVDFYVDGGTVMDASPSRLYRMTEKDLERLR